LALKDRHLDLQQFKRPLIRPALPIDIVLPSRASGDANKEGNRCILFGLSIDGAC
jgi:hypothetical protein